MTDSEFDLKIEDDDESEQPELAFVEPPTPRQLARIRIFDAQISSIAKICDLTVEAIINSGRPIYKRGYVLVEPIWQEIRTNDNPPRIIKQCVLMPINVNRMIFILSKWVVVYYMTVWKGRGSERVPQLEPVHPNKNWIGVLLDIRHWKIPTCIGVINSPTMRSDGSLLTTTGLDTATGLYAFWPDDLQLPTLAERPTKADAEAGLQLLQELIAECAFVGDLDKSVAIAAILTVVMRGAFPVAPLFFFHKPEPGTGGSYLVKIISTIACGREAPPMVISEDEKEFNKELSAAATEAAPILNLNNLSFDLKSTLLSQMISEGELKVRPFGKNTETVLCNCRAMTTIVNGNNIRIVGELIRRALTSRLDTKMDRPETKEYKNDPVAWITQDRGKYIAAILNIVRAFRISGETVMVEPLNGFEAWAEFIQKPLVWLGLIDPVKSQENARERDPERTSLRQRINAVRNHFYDKEAFSASEVHQKVIKTTSDSTGKSTWEYPDLYDAFTRDGKIMSPKSIGWQLSKDEDRIVDTFYIKIVKDDKRDGKQYSVWPRPPKSQPNETDEYAKDAQSASRFKSAFAEGATYRPKVGRFEVIGAEPPGTICAYCNSEDGTVLLVRDPFQSVQSQPLHEQCVERFFAGRNEEDIPF